MRVLLFDGEESAIQVAEVIYATYDSNLFEAKDNAEKIEGMYLITVDKDELLIPMSKDECTKFVRELAVSGYADLSEFGFEVEWGN